VTRRLWLRISTIDLDYDVILLSCVMQVKVNPEYTVAELDYNNNAAICKLVYSGGSVNVSNCVLGRG